MEAKRAELKEEQRRNRRPPVTSVKEKDVVVPLRRTPKYEAMLPQIVEMSEAGSGIDLISRALGIGAEVVRDALHLNFLVHRPTGISAEAS